MSKDKARALFLKRFDALVSAVKDKADPVVRIGRKDWHWIEPLAEDDGDTIRYQGVEILIID